MDVLARIANRLWAACNGSGYRRYYKALSAPERTQQALLNRILTHNKDTAFGKKHGFSSIQNYTGFAQKVPVRNWQDLSSWFGENAHNTVADPILFTLGTSGSTAGAKQIPYTPSLLDEFRAGLSPWIVSMMQNFPEAFKGKAYWSVSPPLFEEARSSTESPALSDRQYFGEFQARLLKHLFAVPDSISHISDAREFYLQTLTWLLKTPSLSFISIWSPTFFLQLDEFLFTHIEEILSNLRQEKEPSPAQLKRLQALHGKKPTWSDIWPRLKLVSCWTHGAAASWLPQVRQRLGSDVQIQAKGLLSTEGITSIPFVPNQDPLLAICSHFYEFRFDDGEVKRSHEVRKGDVCEVILTTGGGLYRYATSDWVEITGSYQDTPSLIFLGRGQTTSDLVGEKLNSQFVQTIFNDLDELREQGHTCFLVPEVTPSPHYTLYLSPQSGRSVGVEWAQTVRNKMEAKLCENPYYRQGLSLGQLKPLKVRLVERDKIREAFRQYQISRNISDGDFKPSSLYPLHSFEGILESV